VEMGSDKINIASNANVDNIQLKVQASNDTEFGETTINLRGLEPIVLIDEVTTGGAELFTDQYNLVQINIPEVNNVPVGTSIKYIGARKDDNLWAFQALIDESVDTDSIEVLLLADSEKLNMFYTQKSSFNQQSSKALNTASESLLSSSILDNKNLLCEEKSDITRYYWNDIPIQFFKKNYRVSANVILDRKIHPIEIASLLCSNKKRDENLQNKVPIIFIHGYAPGKSMGGGKDTWGKFTEYAANNWDFEGRQAIVFNFHWRTNADFKLVADDLSEYIGDIKKQTGEDVHIIAHSFGGVLARVYLQGLNFSANSNDIVPVASLTTIGSPHSGLSDGGGYDSGLLGALVSVGCGQISCYQMGDNVSSIKDLRLKTISLGEMPLSFLGKDFLKNSDTTILPIQVLIGVSHNKTGDGLISKAGQRFFGWDEVTGKELKTKFNFRNSAVVTEKELSTDFFKYFTHNHESIFGTLNLPAFGTLNLPALWLSIIFEELKDLRAVNETFMEVEVHSEYSPSPLYSKSWISEHLSQSVFPKKIAYKINILNQYGEPYNGKFKVTVIGGSGYSRRAKNTIATKNLITKKGETQNGLATIYFRHTNIIGGAYFFDILIEPISNLQIYNNAPIDILEPENYKESFDTGETINLRSVFADESDDTISEKIKLASVTQIDDSTFIINGENLSGNINVCVLKRGSYCQNVELLSQNDANIRARFNFLGGVKKIFVERKNSLGVVVDKSDGLNVHFIKAQDGNLSISTLTPDNINASDFTQKITISGAGFSRDTVVYAQEGNNSTLRSSRFIDENTMSFRLRTWLNTQSPWIIWVETSSKKSNKLALIVDTNVNNTCVANEFDYQSCSISHGIGTKHRVCADDGNSWGAYSSCSVSSCNSGYHASGNSCVADIVIPVPDRPSGLTPGSNSNSSEVLNTTNITLYWSAVNNASKYKLSVFDLNAQRYILEDEYVVGISYNASSFLDFGHQYFWSLHACKSNNECSSRTRVYFNIAGEVITPDVPTGLTPGSISNSNPEEVSGTTQVMRWNVANNASWYKIQIAKEGHIIADETINTNSYTVNNLEPGRKYWWYVEACNNDACADSTGKNFIIEGGAQICTPNSKENRSCSISHGQGSKYKTCSLNGQSWSGYSNCVVTSCDNGYQESNNRCVGAISITPSNTCSSAPTMKVDTNYQININTSDYTFGSPIEQHSYLSGDVRGFWLKVEIPIGYDARNVNISNVNDDFDPVIGLRSNCNYEYYGYADDNAGGGDETFNTRLTGAEEGNNGIYHIRIYHYNGNESPQAIFNIDVTQ
ncbi:fibronectin type III domain-containing protein, partial [Bathymodiolus thermophilus thioautotrophic gill symbiont]